MPLRRRTFVDALLKKTGLAGNNTPCQKALVTLAKTSRRCLSPSITIAGYCRALRLISEREWLKWAPVQARFRNCFWNDGRNRCRWLNPRCRCSSSLTNAGAVELKLYDDTFDRVAARIREQQQPDSIVYVNVLEHTADDENEIRVIGETLEDRKSV